MKYIVISDYITKLIEEVEKILAEEIEIKETCTFYWKGNGNVLTNNFLQKLKIKVNYYFALSNMTQYVRGTFAFITGASKGIGKAIAIEFSKLLQTDCTIVILALARASDAAAITPNVPEATVETTKSEILKMNPHLEVITYELDLATTDIHMYRQIFNKILSNRNENFENAIIFHNAGTVGEVNVTTKLTNFTKWRAYFDLNLFSVALLNSVFLEKIADKANKVTIVNMTSICGVRPFKNLSMYGSGKAARNMFFKVLSRERPNVKVLNYSPGPVDTDIADEVITSATDSEIRTYFTNLKKQKKILLPHQTVGKLIQILVNDQYKSGDFIDYYGRR